MSAADNDTNDTIEIPQVSELDALKARADMMGVKYHPSISLAKLREKVNATIEGTGTDDDDNEPKTKAVVESETAQQNRLISEATKLVRIRVTCMNPAKTEWEGEIFTVGNSVVGTHRKYVAFNTEWHVPHIIYEQMKERQCQIFVSKKDARGNTTREGKMIREFAIEVLPPLTPDELADLARQQAMAGQIA